MKLVFPFIMAAVGIAGGAGAGYFLKPHDQKEAAVECLLQEGTAAIELPSPSIDAVDIEGHEFVKLTNQFVVPIITDQRVGAMIVMSIAVETKAGKTELVYAREPKLRDMFLQVMFDHASVGRFSGPFANSQNLDPLRQELRIVATRILGDAAKDVLITEIARQDS